MVSVLIPVYGESVDAQVASLISEAKDLDYPVEIVICDDASPNPKKPHFTTYKGVDVQYIELSKNLGRSRIRNYLAQQAKYNQLVFIDADCLPIQSNFINTYKQKFETDVVLVGGQLFSKETPSGMDRMLRWTYGTKVEARSIKDRLKSPYRSFMANNFSISKELLTKFPFDKDHSGYGHEDTLFGLQLKNNKVNVQHVKNPIRHLDNETNEQFLEKTIEGVANLASLYKQGKIDSHVKLIKVYEQLSSAGFVGFAKKMVVKRQGMYYKSLLKGNAKLRIFSLFKLVTFIIELEKLNYKG